MPGDVAGHQVGGELDARELAVETASQGPHQQGLAQPGNAFEQYVATGDQCREHIVDHTGLTHHRLAQLGADSLGQLTGALALLDGVGLAVGRFVLFSRQFWRSPNG